MHARGSALETRDALTATKEVVTAVGLPSECNEALNSLIRKCDALVKEINMHIMNIGHGTMTDDIRPILNFGNPGANT